MKRSLADRRVVVVGLGCVWLPSLQHLGIQTTDVPHQAIVVEAMRCRPS
jgi:hypothetical protein